jgi:DNA-binding MarR family transcriptional regulator
VQEKPRLRLVPAHKPANLEDTSLASRSEPCDPLGGGGAPSPPLDEAAAAGPVTIDLAESDIAALKRILSSLAKEAPHAKVSGDGRAEKEIAQMIFDFRMARTQLFPASMFGEPAWDMMMALYIANQAPAAADLARWTNTPLSTAMRWIAYLEGHDLVVRETSAEDRRVQTIRLTSEARISMERLFADFLGKWA